MNRISSLRSHVSRRPRSSIAAGMGVAAAVFLIARPRDEAPVPPPETALPASVIAPRVPQRMVFRPLFKTPDHAFEAGTAFLARVPFCPDPLLITALQNIGPAGGYHTQALAESLADIVSGLELREAYTGEKMLSPEVEALRIPETAPLGTPSAAGDIAAFRARGSRHLDSCLLSDEPLPPPAGSHVWLACGADASGRQKAPEASEMPPRVRHGRVTELRDGLLYYTLDDGDPPLRGSVGAPLLSEGGRIVGIHLGSTAGEGGIHGIATPVSRLLGALRAACQPEPRSAATGGNAQK